MTDKARLRSHLRRRLLQSKEHDETSPLLDPSTLSMAQQLLSADDVDVAASIEDRTLLGCVFVERHRRSAGGTSSIGDDMAQALDMFQPVFLNTDAPNGIPDDVRTVLADRLDQDVTRFLITSLDESDPERLVIAASLLRRVVAATPDDHPDRVRRLSNLTVALYKAFHNAGNRDLLDEAIEVARRARTGETGGSAAITLVFAMRERYDNTHDMPDLNEAINVGRQLIADESTGDADRIPLMGNLCGALQIRYQRSHESDDLREAIDMATQVLEEAPAGDPEMSSHLNNLSHARQLRFGETDDAADLDAAIHLGRRAVDGDALDQVFTGSFSNLALALRKRFSRFGRQADLDESISHYRSAVVRTSRDDTHHPVLLADLGVALRQRFERYGAATDLDEAIAVGRRSVATTPASDAYLAARLNNLGISLQLRFARRGDLADLDEAISTQAAGLEADSSGPSNQPESLSDLAAALRLRYGRTRNTADLESATRLAVAADAAARSSAVNAPTRAMAANNLGVTLLVRYEKLADPDDLQSALRAFQRATTDSPPEHPASTGFLVNYGLALRARYERHSRTRDLRSAVATFREVIDTELSTPWLRVIASKLAAELLAATEPHEAADLFHSALDNMAQAAPRSLELGDQQFILSRVDGIARDAAAMDLAASAPGLPDGAATALASLELGRVLILSRALGDIERLRLADPDAATRLVAVREALDMTPVIEPPGGEPLHGW